MEVSEDFTITLRLGQQPLSITIRREDEEAYRAAEKLINQRYNSYAAQMVLSYITKELNSRKDPF